MAITNLQQARQMYQTGQRVAKTLDGSRPGYRGDDAYGPSSKSNQGPAGGATIGSGSKQSGSPKSRTTSTTPRDTTPTDINDNRLNYRTSTPYVTSVKPQDVARSKLQFIQKLNNDNAIRANQLGTKFVPYQGGSRPKPRSGLAGLLMGALGMFMGIPGLGLLTGGIRSLGGGLKGFNRRMRGVNPDGTTRTQAQYEKARYDRQQVNRLDKLFAAKDRGYNQIGFGDFTKKTMDFTPGQQAKIDQLMAAGYMPSTARNVDSARGSDLRGILNQSNLNDISSLVAASQVPQRFLPSGAAGNTSIQDISTMEMNDAQLAKMAAEGASPQIMAEAQNRLDRARANESAAYKGVAQGFAGEDIQPQEDGIMGIDVGYPSNDLMAAVSAQDLARYSQQGDLTRATDYETAMDTIYQGSQMTPYEYNQLQQGNITQPGTYIG